MEQLKQASMVVIQDETLMVIDPKLHLQLTYLHRQILKMFLCGGKHLLLTPLCTQMYEKTMQKC